MFYTIAPYLQTSILSYPCKYLHANTPSLSTPSLTTPSLSTFCHDMACPTAAIYAEQREEEEEEEEEDGVPLPPPPKQLAAA
jgi:hypothetical protein